MVLLQSIVSMCLAAIEVKVDNTRDVCDNSGESVQSGNEDPDNCGGVNDNSW